MPRRPAVMEDEDDDMMARMRRRMEANDESSDSELGGDDLSEGSHEEGGAVGKSWEQASSGEDEESGSEEEAEAEDELPSSESEDEAPQPKAKMQKQQKPIEQANVPLFQRVVHKASKSESIASANFKNGNSVRQRMKEQRAKARGFVPGSADDAEENNNFKFNVHKASSRKTMKRNDKNAPAEMRSDRPVSRFRDDLMDHSLKRKKAVDPRFSDLSGTMSSELFRKNYDFLNAYQDDEINKLERAIKKMKNQDKVDHLKIELSQRKQQKKERVRAVAVAQRLREHEQKQREKRKEGKSAFYLKKSAKREIELEERYKELKASGKLKKYMQKQRLKNVQKAKKSLPSQGGRDE